MTHYNFESLTNYEAEALLRAARFYKQHCERVAHSDSQWQEVFGIDARVITNALECVAPKHF